ncbi:hypothetical protein EKG83_10300 [Saccharothrix syringae]|uniref:Uncharacterized protein n=1 Tax=Saccharothrix syringae TaxID=103733 RepID=A0A5Q0GV74_SACSY|nr:hypothetical protein EKG83_10300 [Saccharothrix syringae]
MTAAAGGREWRRTGVAARRRGRRRAPRRPHPRHRPLPPGTRRRRRHLHRDPRGRHLPPRRAARGSALLLR